MASVPDKETPEAKEGREAREAADRASERASERPTVGNVERAKDALDRLADSIGASPKGDKAKDKSSKEGKDKGKGKDDPK